MASKSTDRPLPGRPLVSREFVVRHQRARIVAALAQEVSERGYQAVTVAALVKRAGIARATFYENFSSKEECFLATQNLAMEAALKRVVEAAGEIEDWPRRVVAGLAAFLDFVVEEPALARTCMVEALAAGPASVKQHEESLQSFVTLFKLGRDVSPPGGEIPEALEEATIGGVFWIVHRRLLDSEDEEIKGLLPGLVEFALTPYVGVGAAKDLSTHSRLLQNSQKTG
ncbi:MAG: TetR/AcrR family transcriptional regulator [Solirubrobacterales bacterium]